MNAESSYSLTADPAWPWSVSAGGLTALLVAGAVLVTLTVWTYLGVPRAGYRRVAVLLALRLLALLLAFISVLRPSIAARDEMRLPSVLVVVADASKSMNIADEFNQKTRWEALTAQIDRCTKDGLFQQLADEQNVTVVFYRFGDDVADFDPKGKADGEHTDFGQMLYALHQKHSAERNLRGLIILSDGADNGIRYPTLAEATKWRLLGCPIYAFGLGSDLTSPDQRDVAITALTPNPSPAPIKSKVTFKLRVDAPGFENSAVQAQLFYDDKQVPFLVKTEGGEERPIKTTSVTLPKSRDNEVELFANAPDTPGEVKLTLRLQALPGEVSTANNEISTYLTVVKEGLSVLYIDKLRWERIYLVRALQGDPRIRLYEAVRQTDDPPLRDQADLFKLDQQAYDVIILGDVSAKRLSAGNLQILEQIRKLVVEKGVGLMMTGGLESFGGTPEMGLPGDWDGTPIGDILPVKLNVSGHVNPPLPMVPTDQGLQHFIMRMEPDAKANAALWARLNDPKVQMLGMNRLGEAKSAAAKVLARVGDKDKGAPLLVGQDVGKGRTLAFGGDSTWFWSRLGQPKSRDGVVLHQKFWKQTVLWLAHQEEVEGNVWVKPEFRRMAAGGKQLLQMGLRGKTGLDLPDATYTVRVIGPDGAEHPLNAIPDGKGARSTFWKTDKAGEYRVVVSGEGKDADGKPVSGVATARFLTYQDESEMLRQAANHEFLEKLAATGGGRFFRAEDLPRFLQDLKNQPLSIDRAKTRYWPDWKRNSLSGFLPSLFLLFVALLGVEWGLRRYWGLV